MNTGKDVCFSVLCWLFSKGGQKHQMDIQDTEFWKNLVPIFSIEPDEDSARTRGKPGASFCEEGLLLDRLRQAITRAKRNDHHVLLLLVQLGDGDNSAVPGKEDEARVTELAMRRLGRCLRSVDTLCNRGSRQIAILLEELRESTPIPLVVEKIHSILQYPFSFEEIELRLLPTTGASLFPSDGDEADQLWVRANLALGKACQDTPGAYRFSPTVVARHIGMERFELTRDLHRAYRSREFTIAYQPVFSIEGKILTGLKTFSRWQHPQRGELKSYEFIHLLEESGLIAPIGEQLMSDACRFARILRDAGHGSLRLCIDISARQLVDPGFLLAILDALYDADIRPQWLQLEFPQALLKRYPETVSRIFPRLKEAGIRIAIDHYAVDSIALDELESLQVSLVKLDRERVSQLLDESALRSKLAATVKRAQGTGINFAVAGIETVEQLQLFNVLGFSEAEGAFFTPPLDEAGLQAWLSG